MKLKGKATTTVRSKEMIHPALYVMECPNCREIVASASERELLPEWTTCDCKSREK